MLNSNFRVKLIYVLPLLALCLSANAYHQVSIINLIANPEKYLGMDVETKGFLQYNGELLLYVDQVRAKNVDFPSAVLVQDKSTENRLVEQCGNKYVAVQGKVGERSRQLIIMDIINIFPLSEHKSCWEKQKE